MILPARHICSLCLAGLFLLFTGGPASAQSRLPDAPSHLLEQPGVERKDGVLYATGLAEPGAYRDDKAHETARQRSLALALRMLHVAAVHQDLLDDLDGPDALVFLGEISRAASALSLTGVEVLRQWEQDEHSLTLVAVPLQLVERSPPAFADMAAAIRAYLALPNHSLDGLHFCLTRTSPHTREHAQARRLVGKILSSQSRPGLAAALDPPATTQAWADSPMAPLLIQQAWARAEHDFTLLKQQAPGLEPEQILQSVDAILQTAPAHAPSLRLLADVWLDQDRPGLALAAAEQSLRGGMEMGQGLERMVRALDAMRSPEVQVYALLRGQTNSPAWAVLETDPGLTPEARLILDSLGRAMVLPMIPSLARHAQPIEKPGKSSSYAAALRQFDRAATKADLEHVLATLFQACATEPGNPELHNLTGATLRLLDRPLEALPFFWQALRLSPDHDLALTNLALCCEALGLGNAAEFYRNHRAVRVSTHPWVREQVKKWREG